MRVFIITSLFLFTFSACHHQINDEWIVSSPSQKADIVLYFKKGTKNDDVNYFLDNVIGYQRADGRGTNLMQGIQGQFSVRNQDYEGYAIELRKSVTSEERESILNAIKNSPLIFKVFENVVPNEIVLDAAKAKKEKEELEKVKQDNRPAKTIVVTNSAENK